MKFPDTRGWALIGFFALTAYTMRMIEANPSLLGVPSFMQFASQLAGGGLLLAAAWLYSAGKRDGEPPTDVKVINPPDDPVPVDPEIKS
jgi:hypothetical protein